MTKQEQKIQSLARLFQQEHSLFLTSKKASSPEITTLRFSVDDRITEGICKERNVYLTVGMGNKAMNCDQNQHIELSAFSHLVYTDELEGDYIATILNWFAHYPFVENTYLEHAEIFDWESPFYMTV